MFGRAPGFRFSCDGASWLECDIHNAVEEMIGSGEALLLFAEGTSAGFLRNACMIASYIGKACIVGVTTALIDGRALSYGHETQPED